MSLFDLVLIIIIAAFGFAGLWSGLVKALGAFVGTILGVFVASHYYGAFADWLYNLTQWSPNLTKVIAFIIIFILVNKICGLIFYIVNKILGLITGLPFINLANRLLGFAFGAIEGIIVITLTFYFISRYPLGEKFMSAFGNSQILPYLQAITIFFKPFIPQAIRLLKSAVSYF